jgi:hypothetical protein
MSNVDAAARSVRPWARSLALALQLRHPQVRLLSLMRDRPEEFGGRVTSVLEREHGPRWRALISTNGEAWLQLADTAAGPGADLYDGRLEEVRAAGPAAPHGGCPASRQKSACC